MQRILFVSKPFLATSWLVIMFLLLAVVALNPNGLVIGMNQVKSKLMPRQTADLSEYTNTSKRTTSTGTILHSDLENILSNQRIIKMYGVIDSQQLLCMAKNVYYEAGAESLMGKLAVAQVVLNRLEQAKQSTICGIVYAKDKNNGVCQFSWTCNDSLPTIATSSQTWRDSQSAIMALLTLKTQSRDITDITNGATHYHNLTVDPIWNKSLKKVMQIDNHIFYK